MSKNIFIESDNAVAKAKRNGYDMRKLVNGTYKEGYLYPIDWTEVTFGDSIKIDIRAALRTMPMVWPIQTPILVKFYTFYWRNRCMWKNFMDFRFNNKQKVHPYIASAATDKMWKTGEIADHLGVPTTLMRDNAFVRKSFGMLPDDVLSGANRGFFQPFYRKSVGYLLGKKVSNTCSYDYIGDFKYASYICMSPLSLDLLNTGVSFIKDLVSEGSNPTFLLFADVPTTGFNCVAYQTSSVSLVESSEPSLYYADLNSGNVQAVNYTSDLDLSHGLFGWLKSIPSDAINSVSNRNYYLVISSNANSGEVTSLQSIVQPIFELPDIASFIFGSIRGQYELTDVANPFAGAHPAVPLSALPFRCYEGIYRSYFQDFENEPFILDGEPQYNRYITNDGDGPDTTPYELKRRNWEADFLTSCKPSPQQGLAPLVGISSLGDITLLNSQGNEYTVRLETSDGDHVDAVNFAHERGEADASIRRTLAELVTSGISINSFRNVNAYQHFLEANIRRGLKFKDQVFSNTGVKLEYKELDMPEFLGGFTIPLNVNTINQTSETGSSPLGTQGANAGCYGASKHSITHYCDEEGIVMTLMCITPIPIYSQVLNKSWIKSMPVDYYNQQFGRISYQPVTYEEVCPIQAYNEGKDVHDVFGYQRPWYHLISSVDEAHGKFRTDMSGFLQMRVFGQSPELGADFLHIKEEDLTDVFVISDEEKADPFFGQIAIDKYKKTAIPRHVLPAIN